MAGRDDSINKLIHVFSQPVQNSLTDQSVFAAQPTDIKVPLKPHQLTMIQAMGERETKCIDGFTIDGEIHHSQFAVLGDKVGSGKTLMMLAHIAKMRTAPPENVFRRVHPNSRVAFWSERSVCEQECSGNTLIIVPHTLFHQWKHAIQTQTNLSFLEVRTTKTIERTDFLTLIKQRDVTLISNTTIRNLMADPLRAALQWKRIVFDEVDSVHFTSTTHMPKANFYWLITATWGNFLFHGLYVYLTDSYLNTHAAEFHPDLLSILQQEQLTNSANYYARYDVKSHAFFEKFLGRHPNRGHLVLRNSDGFMADSWRAPTVHEERIICESPMVHRVIANFVTPEVQELLHAGDTQGAFERLGVSNTTKSSLIEVVCESREKELDRLQKTLTYKETMEYATHAAKEQALQSLRGKIQSIQTQINELNARITNFKNEMCAICFEEPTLPTFVMCCNRVYCGKCLMEWLQRAGSCALCRQNVDSKMLRQLKEGEESPKGRGIPKDSVIIPKKPKKREALLNSIIGAKDGRFLVFNRYDNPFVELEEQLKELGYRVATVRGNKDHVSNILKQFEKGEIQILLMNSTQAGAGMDLKSATHIILMHAMKKEEEKQIVGRAMRLGRTDPLRLVRLLHENEQMLA